MNRAWLLLVGLVIVWGSHWVVVKVGLETIPGFTYGVLRLATGIAVLVALMAATGRARRPYREDLPIIFSYGLLAVALLIITMNLALPYIPAGRSAILAYTIPLWVVPVMAVVARVLPSRAEVVGLVLGAIGASVALVHVRVHPWRGTPFDTQVWQLLVALVPMVLLMLLLERDRLIEIEWDLQTILVVLYSGPLATAFAFWASQMIVRSLGPLTTGIGYLGAPVVGVIAGIIVLGEVITALDIVGVLVTTAGIVVVLLGGRSGSVGRTTARTPSGRTTEP